LAEYLKQTAKLLYGLTKKSSKNENGVVMPQSWEKEVLVTWLRGLRKRRESLCLRKPEATIHTRCTRLNGENVRAFFENLRALTSRHNFTAHKI
jgi:hypothetical protein